MKKKRVKEFVGLHPVITYVLLCGIVLAASLLFALFNAQSTYTVYSEITKDYSPITESVNSMVNLSGLKYIFTESVANFANFTVLINLIIILIGIGIMDKTGFMETSVTLLTKKAKKTTITFVIILICLFASIIGDLAYIIFIPLTALFFFYGKRNPFIGIIASFGALTVGSGLSPIFTAIDSRLTATTTSIAGAFSSYAINITAFSIISLLLIFALAFVLTRITENYVAKKMPKYEFKESELIEDIVTRKELRGMIFSIIAGILYLVIILYNIIPGLPFSGNLLDNSQILYIDKLFSYESFFSNGFVFIIAMFFVILGFAFGLGSGSIKNNKDVVEGLGYSLDGIGKTLLLIFGASLLISIFKQTNIGNTLVVYLTSIIAETSFTGLPLVILLLLISIISTIFVPSALTKWPIIATAAVPAFMNTNLSPEFAQLVFRLGESVSMGITPLLSYFVVYLAFMEKYNQSSKSISVFSAIKMQVPYALAAFVLILLVIIIFYITNIPLGIGGSVAL